MNSSDDNVIACAAALNRPGGVAVLRTDTLYGIVARADDQLAVENVYKIRHRNSQKSSIVLVADIKDAYGYDESFRKLMTEQPSEPTSFLLPAGNAPSWLVRQNEYLAYRVPQVDWLRDLIRQTGPLIAPSANPEGLPPAMNISDAQRYFGDQVDCYLDGGEVPADQPPSRVVRIDANGNLEQLR